jgi:hypothetical protein
MVPGIDPDPDPDPDPAAPAPTYNPDATRIGKRCMSRPLAVGL